MLPMRIGVATMKKPTQDDIDRADIKEHRRIMKRIRAGKEKVMTSDQLLDYLDIR